MTGIEAFINLNTLTCSDNLITSLDISGCLALKHLDCSNNLLPSLDVSNNPALEDLHCSSNQLTSLNLSRNTALRHLSLDGMTALSEVCVWEMPFPSSVEVYYG